MDSKDLRSVVSSSEVPPAEEAAQNISRSRLFDVSPDQYHELKSELEPKAMSLERVPATVEPVTQEFLKESKQRFAVAQNDIAELSDTEKIFKRAKSKIFDEPELRRKKNELVREQMLSTDGILSPEKQEFLNDHRKALQEMGEEDPTRQISNTEKFLTDVGAAGVDILRSYKENYELVGAPVLIGAGLGAAGGFIGGMGNPAAVVVGAKMGAGSGLGTAMIAVPFVDAYKESAPGIYDELSQAIDDKKQPLNLSHGRKMAVSNGAAFVSAVAAAYAGKVFANNNPFLKKFTDPSAAAKYIIGNPKLMAKFDILGGIFKSGAGEGFEEIVQNLAEKTSVEFGKIDGSEESFMNALDNIANMDTVKDALYSGAVGFGAGGAVSTATNAPMYSSVKKGYEETQRMSMEKKQVLESQNMMLEANAILANTKIQELAPEEAAEFKKNLFEKLGFDLNAWFSIDDLKKFADSPEKGKKIRSFLDLNPEMIKLSQDTNSAIPLSKAVVLDMMSEFPDLSEHMRNAPDGQSPFEVRNEAKEFTDKMTKFDERRKAVLETLGVIKDNPDAAKVMQEAIGDLKESRYFQDEVDFLDNSRIEPVEGIMSDVEAQDFNTSLLNANLEVAKSLKEDVDSEFNTKENKAFKETSEAIARQEIKEMGDDVTLLQRFEGKKKFGKTNRNKTLKGEHQEVGNFSPYAIDPRYLADDLRDAYLSTPALVDRKVFVAGGLHPDEAAAFLGVESGEVLLKKLANLPDKKTLNNKRKQREIELRSQIQQGFKSERLKARDESFNKTSTINLRVMKHMVSKELPTLKRGFIKIARSVPTVKEVNLKAKETIKTLKIRDINPNQFKQGYNRSQNAAAKQYANAEFEQSFENRGKAVLNSELMRESLKAKDKVNSFQKFWKRMSESETVQELRDAGYLDAMNEFMELYKLNGNSQLVARKKAFAAWVKKQAEIGEDVANIPPHLDDTQVSYKDLTVEQYQAITEMGQNILHIAKRKNAVLKARKDRLAFETQERIAEEIKRLSEEHIDYKDDRAKIEEDISDTADEMDKIHNRIKGLASAVKNGKHIIAKMDNYKPDGFFYKTFIAPLVDAQTAKRQENFDLRDYKKKVINKYYGNIKKYTDAMNERLEIPEFSKIDTLNNGEMTRVSLMRLAAIIGDPNGRQRISNFVGNDGVALDFETVRKVLETHLSSKDVEFVQNFFTNPFARFTKAAMELEKRTKGFEPEMVEAAPWIHNGKVIPGGYQPLDYQRLPDELKAEQQLRRLADEGLINDEGEFFARRRASEMTNQDRMKERTGSKRPLELSLRNHFDALEETIHDLHFREVGMDMMKILKSAENVNNMKAVIGSKEYNVLFDGIKDVVSKASDKDSSTVYKEQNRIINGAVGTVKSLHAIKTISYNVSSAAIQFDSLFYLPLRAGPKTMLYLSKNIAKMATNVWNYPQFVKDAQALNPDIKFEQDAIDDSVVKSFDEIIPSGNTFIKNYKTLGKGVTRIKQLRKKAIDMSFFMLREVDKMNKVIAAVSLGDQFLSGDIEGYPQEKLDKMSPAEKKETMQRVIKQLSDQALTASSTLDKTAIEKSDLGKVFANYWTDGRSRLNTIAAQGDQFRREVKKGDYREAATRLMWFGLVTGASGAFVNAVRDREESMIEDMKKIKDPGDAALFGLSSIYNIFASPMIDSIPVANSVKYAIESSLNYKGQVRPVSVPVVAVLTDTAAGVVALSNLLESGLKFRRMKKKDRKALITLGGYMVGGAPTNTVNKLIDIVGDRKNQRNVKDFVNDVTTLNGLINETVEEYKDEPEYQEFIEDLKEEQKSLPQTEQDDVSHQMPENTKETLKASLSGGDWTKFDEETGAVGVYQFTEERWKELMVSNPELGLTENGRLAKNPSQQEKAMDVELQSNTKDFMAYDIPITEENLLGAHVFGVENFAAIFASEPDQKLSDILGEQAKNPVFKKFDTVKSVKNYLSGQIKKAK